MILAEFEKSNMFLCSRNVHDSLVDSLYREIQIMEVFMLSERVSTFTKKIEIATDLNDMTSAHELIIMRYFIDELCTSIWEPN